MKEPCSEHLKALQTWTFTNPLSLLTANNRRKLEREAYVNKDLLKLFMYKSIVFLEIFFKTC